MNAHVPELINQGAAIDSLMAAMREQGIETQDSLRLDGTLERFYVEGDRKGSKNGWVCAHLDAKPAGQFGCNKRFGSHKFSWKAERSLTKALSPAELKALRDRAEKQRQERVEQTRQRQQLAAERAKALWDAAVPAPADHPYLARKAIGAHGVRLGVWEVINPDTGEVRVISDKALLVPFMDRQRNVRNLQAILPGKLMSAGTRDKDFLKDGEKLGLFFPIGTPRKHDGRNVFIIAEGFATGASIHEATGHCVLVTFDTSNLLAVADSIRERQADAIIVIGADNDQWTLDPVANPGLHYARKAAAAVGGFMAYPSFPASAEGRPTDFNDLHARQGIEAVAAVINHAVEKGKIPAEPELPAHVTEELPAPAADVEEAQWEPMDEVDTALASKVMGTLRVHQEQLPAAAGGEDGPIYDPKNPMPTARDMVARLWTRVGERALQSYQGEFMEWSGAHYEEASKGDIEARCWVHLEGSSCWVKNPSVKSFDDAEKIRDGFKPDQAKVSNVLGALRAVTNVPASMTMPSWIKPTAELPPAEEMVSCLNGLFHLQTDCLIPHTPNFFCSNSLPFDYDADAAAPVEWLKFLQSTFGDDQEAIDALQLMFGYLLTHDTSLQKIFLLIGPPRCGKGTILRTIEQLLGKRNICAPELNNLHQTFALEEFVGKQAALVGDIRISPKADQAFIAARLLTISGGDNISVDRKHKKAWIGKLTTRFVMCSNMTPSFSDSSGAMASRFVIFKMKNSFLGNEDLGLDKRLEAEMPAILKWAVEGWRKLQVVGRITSPSSAQETVEELDDLASPIRKFIREECQVGPQDTFRVPTADLYEAWRRWCADHGREHPGTEASFGRDLSGALHGQVKRGRTRSAGASRGDKNDRTPTYLGIKLNNESPFDY